MKISMDLGILKYVQKVLITAATFMHCMSIVLHSCHSLPGFIRARQLDTDILADNSLEAAYGLVQKALLSAIRPYINSCIHIYLGSDHYLYDIGSRRIWRGAVGR